MKLNSLRLQNFRCFKQLNMTFDPRLTVIVASNGGGKTTILDAVPVIFGTYLGAFPSVKGTGIDYADIYSRVTNQELGKLQIQQFARIDATGVLTQSGDVVSWFRALNSKKSGTTIKDARVVSNYAKVLQITDGSAEYNDLSWPVLAYYGTGRLWNQKRLTEKKQYASGFYSREAGYMDCMEPASSYKLVLDWLRYASKANSHAKIRFMESHPDATPHEVKNFQGPFSALLRAVSNAANTVLAPSGWKNIAFSEIFNTAVVEHDEYGLMPVSQLSDGIRNTIALVADLAYRATQLNPHLGERAAIESSGIVLIDEVDMHLHPGWQQTILTDLITAFPKLQFIVTTHSPQVLSTVPSECIRILKDGQVFAAPPGSEGAESSRLLKQVLGLADIRPLDNPATKELKEYLALVDLDEWKTPRALELRKILDARYQGYEPALLEADLHIENRKWELGQA
jgi:predicted ATP-binding protein involved in virulence